MKLRDGDDDDDDVNALRAPLWVLGTGFCVSIGSFGSSNTPRLQPLLLGLLSAPMNEQPPPPAHSVDIFLLRLRLRLRLRGPACMAKSESHKTFEQISLSLIDSGGKKHLHNFKVVALVTYGYITIAVRQSTVAWSP